MRGCCESAVSVGSVPVPEAAAMGCRRVEQALHGARLCLVNVLRAQAHQGSFPMQMLLCSVTD